MSRNLVRIVTLGALGALLGCGATGGTQLTQVFKEPTYAGGKIEKIMILGVAKTDARRRVFENRMLALFAERGIEAVPSWEVIPAGKEIDKEVVKKAIDGRGFDAVLVTRLVSIDTKTEHVPGRTYVDSYWDSPHYSHFYSGYPSAYALVHEPGYTYENKIVSLETNVYEVATERLVFAALSETLNPDGANEAIDTFGLTVIGELARQKMID